MAEQARFGKAKGIKRTIVQKNGDLVRLAPDGPHKITSVRNGRLVLDGALDPAASLAEVVREQSIGDENQL
jgi:ribonuclease J